MTLWRVADEPTAQFMQMFYERLLRGTDVDGALGEARREMRKLFPSPYYWAGFVLLEQ
jgi:CHAT domain-containing protein